MGLKEGGIALNLIKFHCKIVKYLNPAIYEKPLNLPKSGTIFKLLQLKHLRVDCNGLNSQWFEQVN